MSTRLTEYDFVATHRSRHTTVPSQDVIKRLLASMGTRRWVPSTEAGKQPELFRQEIEQGIGPHGFMMFHTIDHGYSLGRLDSYYGYATCLRVTLGNPLIAAQIQQIDSSAGLHVPVDLLIREIPRRLLEARNDTVEELEKTVVSYLLPSSLIASKEKALRMAEADYQRLLQVAKILDDGFEGLIEHICAPDSVSRARL